MASDGGLMAPEPRPLDTASHWSDSTLITFQIDVGLAANDESGPLVSRSIAPSDIASGVLHLGHLRGRVLSVAAAKFANQLAQALSDRYDLA